MKIKDFLNAIEEVKKKDKNYLEWDVNVIKTNIKDEVNWFFSNPNSRKGLLEQYFEEK